MINGITFDLQNVMSVDDAKLMWRLGFKKNGIMSGCAVTESSGTLTVAAGYLTAYGRLSKIVGSENISAPTVTTGTIYCRLVYEIDLSQVNTLEQFNQGSIKILQSSGSYPSLTQENLDESGNVYQIPLAKFTVTSSGVSNLVDERAVIDYDCKADRPTNTVQTNEVAAFTSSGNLKKTSINIGDLVTFQNCLIIWENQNPNSAFAAQTINIPDSYFGENYFLVVCEALSSETEKTYANFLVHALITGPGVTPEKTIMSMFKLAASTSYKREVTATVSGRNISLEFSNGYSGTSAGGTYCVPVAVYSFR